MAKKLLEDTIYNIIGNKYNRLTVVEYLGHYTKEGTKQKRHWYRCECDCGNKNATVHRNAILKGSIKSCGCVVKVKCKELFTTHGMRNTKLYKKYAEMKKRCYNMNCGRYSNYGGRGIKVCDKWLDDFMNFYNWSMENGYEEGLSIDRIDVNGNYEPSNCRWITIEQQANNKQNTKYLTIDGVTKSVQEWSRESGINPSTLIKRYESSTYPKSKLLKPTKRKNKEIL